MLLTSTVRKDVYKRQDYIGFQYYKVISCSHEKERNFKLFFGKDMYLIIALFKINNCWSVIGLRTQLEIDYEFTCPFHFIFHVLYLIFWKMCIKFSILSYIWVWHLRLRTRVPYINNISRALIKIKNLPYKFLREFTSLTLINTWK